MTVPGSLNFMIQTLLRYKREVITVDDFYPERARYLEESCLARKAECLNGVRGSEVHSVLYMSTRICAHGRPREGVK
eukprot:849077-Amphidinium_carterae.2